MRSRKSIIVSGIIVTTLLFGAWAVESQVDTSSVTPADFDPGNENDHPQTNVIDIKVYGLASLGEVYMLEGIENETLVEYKNGSTVAGETTFPRMVLHGVFDRLVRDWRDDVISGDEDKKDIELYLRNKSNKKVLRIRFYNCWPVRFSLPPFSVDNSTRYLERLELVYDTFEIFNT